MLKVFFKPFIFIIPIVFLFLQGVATIIDGNSLELVKKYPFYFAGYVLLIYLYLAYKEYRQKQLEDKNEKAQKELEELKEQRLELKTLDLTDVESLMEIIEMFEPNKWYRAGQFSNMIYKVYNDRMNIHFVIKALKALGEKGLIDIRQETAGGVSFRRK
jgi:hypothetical protein